MSRVVVFDRKNYWLPKVVSAGEALRLEFAGGADAQHDPRTFSVPIEEEHLVVLREDLARHVILWSALGPLCFAAGISDPLDDDAAVGLLAPILLGRPEEVDALLKHTDWDRTQLVAYGADVDLLESGRVVESMSAATERPDWQRAQEYDADRHRAQRGVTLSPLDAAILRFTGQYLHGSTIPRRDPEAVDPALLPEVLRVIDTAERACTGLRIDRDARRGKTGTDKQDWKLMEAAVEAAVRGAYPELAADAVTTVSFLMCSEAARRARTQPFDVDAADDEAQTQPRVRTLTFTDDREVEEKWNPGDDRRAVEAFWEFVADRIGSRNEVFTLEDEALGEGIQLHFYASSLARIATVSDDGGEAETKYRVEYGLIDDLAHYRAIVRGYVSGGFDALDGLAVWMSDHSEFEEARRRRDSPGEHASPAKGYVFRDDAGSEQVVLVHRPQEAYVAFSSFFKGRDAGVFTIEDQESGQSVVLMPRKGVISRAAGAERPRTEFLKVGHANAYLPAAMLFFENGFSGLSHYGQWLPSLGDVDATPEERGAARAETITTESMAIHEVARIWGDSGIVDPTDQYYVFFDSHSLDDDQAERAELLTLIELLGLERVHAPAEAADGEVWVRTDPRLDVEFEKWA
ncbi:DUF6357 domain-containing protein [Occultella aeris]|uniref:Uncharacterized protein n=1 Tax=Occultella aeris TaxID=2761496 RepID=A0A7M4DPS7_9MICO|nr:DUF6357 family protein [Occultella aeris]VZO39471.1 hypothetical protein HALOF300_04159 [Occultella aeris]